MEKKKIISINIFISSGMLLSVLLLCTIGYFLQKDKDFMIFLQGLILYGSFLFWFFLYSIVLQKELGLFAKRIGDMMDRIQKDKEVSEILWKEDSIFDHIGHRMTKLYHIMQQNREEIKKEKRELLKLITDISHQTKTPMANLKLIEETMQEHKLTQKQQEECLHTIGVQLNKLDFLIESMIKASRLETGVMELQIRNSNLLETLAGAVGQVYRKAENKEIEIMVECSEELYIFHDRKWTEEVFFNILDNAVKYTRESGKIKISVLEQELYARIDIADNGIGIEEKNQGAIFQRFYREEEVHDIEGIGIGLYLARKIVTMQGGYILLNSKKGEGSCFSIYLPIGKNI